MKFLGVSENAGPGWREDQSNGVGDFWCICFLQAGRAACVPSRSCAYTCDSSFRMETGEGLLGTLKWIVYGVYGDLIVISQGHIQSHSIYLRGTIIVLGAD